MKRLSAAIQESLVALLCYDDVKIAKAVWVLVPAKTYDPYFREIVEEAGAYLDRYGKPAGAHTADIFDSLKVRKPEEVDIFDRIHRSLQQTRSSINREYVLTQAGNFVRRQSLKVAVQKVLPLLQRDDPAAVDEAEALMVNSAKRTVNLASPGLLFNDPSQALQFLDNENEQILPLGIGPLDECNIGPIRKGMFVTIAPPNRGKTWFAVHKGKQAIIHGDRVLHVTLEMAENRIAQRYVQALFAVSKRVAKDLVIQRFVKDEHGRLVDFEEQPIKKRPSLADEDIRAFLLKRIKPLSTRPKLVIKQFPTGQLTTRQFAAYLDHLEAAIGFIPDTILLDYPDLMEIDSKAYRHDLGRIYKDLRGIAVERNQRMCAYSQSNRLGATAKVIDVTKVAEDFSKVATADDILTYNQTDAEYRLGLARLFVAKAREEVKNFQVLISQAYAIGQFALDATRMVDSTYWPMVDRDEEAKETAEME